MCPPTWKHRQLGCGGPSSNGNSSKFTHISGTPGSTGPLVRQSSLHQVRGAGAWGASALSSSIHALELQGRENGACGQKRRCDGILRRKLSSHLLPGPGEEVEGGPESKVPSHAQTAPEPTVTQVKTRSARRATSGVRRLPFRALFSLSGSASGSSSRLRVSWLGDIPTCPGLRPGRGRSESRRAPPPCPTRRAPRPGSTGNPAPSVHPDGAVPAPTLHPPRPAHLRPLPA